MADNCNESEFMRLARHIDTKLRDLEKSMVMTQVEEKLRLPGLKAAFENLWVTDFPLEGDGGYEGDEEQMKNLRVTAIPLEGNEGDEGDKGCLLYTSPSPRD